MRPRARAAARIALGAALLALLLWWVDPRALALVLRGADPAWLALGLASAVAANVASALRWWALARWLGAGVRAGWALATYFRGVAINALLPGAVVGGDLYRTHALARTGLPLLEAGVSVLTDRLSGLWLLVVVGAAAAAFGLAAGEAAAVAPLAAMLGGHGHGVLAGLALLLLLLPLAVLLGWQRGVARPQADGGAAERPWHRRLVLIAHRPRALAQYSWQVLGSTAVQLLSIGTLACGGAAVGVDLPWWAWAAVAVPVFLLATLPVSFGGWGTREAAAIVALGAFGVGAPQAVAVSMLYGLAALAQALGGLGLLLGRRG
ncbi:MAG: flippase-like domain-containing protein [Burkholderiaceae bacterium]|nr:flippase-like domain-containing protein [Burkholderiaceae bacterium]